jgi:hypothetical protein
LPRPKEYKLMIAEKWWNSTVDKLSAHEREMIHDKLTTIIKFDPYDSESLKSPLEGLRSYNKFESDLRIIFAICYDCRKEGFTKVNNCRDCDSAGNDVVMLFVAGPHSLYDTLGRERRKRLRKRAR